MEEKNGTVETQEVKMISVEQANAQMQALVAQLQPKIQQLTHQVQQLDAMLRDKTLEHLFNVFKYQSLFSEEFVVKCTKVVENYLTQVALTESEQSSEETTPGLPVEEA